MIPFMSMVPFMAGTGDGIVEAILSVFASIGAWIVETVPTLFPLFYSAESGLTIMGVLAIAGLAFSVMFLLIGVIQRFLHFRG